MGFRLFDLQFLMTNCQTPEYHADGSLKEMVDRKGITSTYAYDVHGRLEEETAGNIEISYTYDENGNQLTITDDTGTTTRVYDELGRVISKTVRQRKVIVGNET